MTTQWGSATQARLYVPGTRIGGEEPLEEGRYAVAAADGVENDSAVIHGSREDMTYLARWMLAQFAERPGGPAVTFDPDGFRVWLDTSNEPGVDGAQTNREVGPQLSTAYERGDGEAGWVAETTLDMLHSSNRRPHPGVPAAWTYGPGVSGVKVWATAHPEDGADGGLTGEVVVDGVTLSLGRLSEDDLVPAIYDRLPGYEAAEHALTALADRVNHTAVRFRAGLRQPQRSLFAGLSGEDIECALLTLAEYRRGCPDLSRRQEEVADRVTQIVADADAVDHTSTGD